MSQKMKVKDLIAHKDNSWFFDDIEGDAWGEFLQSIKTSGVIEPIVVTQDKVIVSGHQRVRACKELGIDEIEAEVRIIDSEDELLKQLIETNIRQRNIPPNPIKFGRCLKELERIYGVRDGSAGNADQNNLGGKTQTDLANQLGLTTETIRNYKLLAEAIPEIQTLVETGIVTPTTARAIVRKLPEYDQRKLAEQLSDVGKKVTGSEVNKEIARLKAEYQDVKEERDYLQFQLEEEQKQKKHVVTETIEVYPDDYEDLKKTVETSRNDYKFLEKEREKDREKIKELKGRIKDLESRSDIEVLQKKLETEAGYFAIRTYEYIQKNGGYVWITERIDQLPKKQRKEFIATVYAIDAFAKQMVQNIGGYGIE